MSRAITQPQDFALKKYLTALAIGGLGGGLFSLIHFPIPWTLGPLAAISIARFGFNLQIYWPAQIRNIAMLVLGYAMGRSFTPETGRNIVSLLPILTGVTIITVALCLLGGLITRRYTGLSLATSLFGSTPAGLSQMATICENIEDADVAAITLMQTVRVLTVVFIVPFITLHGLANDVLPRYATVLAKIGIRELMTIAGFFGVILILIHLTKYVKIPGRYIIAPILGTAALVLSGINAPGLPPSIIMLAQLCVGIRMGTAINISNLTNWRKIFIFTLVNVTGVIGVLIALDYFITRISSVSFLTAFISTAPGGMTEMGLTAMMVHADLSIVIAFQLFRLLFVLLLVIPAVNCWVNRSKKESIAE